LEYDIFVKTRERIVNHSQSKQEKKMNGFIEKRQHPRTDVRWPIKVSVNDNLIDGETMNIALNGISICCDEPLPLNEVVEISIEPIDDQAIVISGKVVWADVYGIADKNNTYGMGICFVEISEKDRNHYNELVAVLLEQ
jgi:hypothetical protein